MRLRLWIGLTAAILLAAGSVIASVVYYADDQSDLDRREQGLATRAARLAESSVKISVGQLSGGAALFQAGGDISRREFELVGESLLDQGILYGAGYAPRVRDSERAAYERLHHFPITERVPGGGLRKAARRKAYYPLTYVAADRSPTPVLGYDLLSDPDRAPDLREARDTGRAVATPLTRLVLGGLGVNIFHAVYDTDRPGTVAARRHSVVGFAAGSIKVADLAGVTDRTLPDGIDSQLRIDGKVVAGAARLDDSSSAPITVADRTWVLTVRDPASADISLPLLLAVLGVSLAALLTALIMIWSRNERLVELQREAGEDPLTGLKNRRRFEEELQAAMARARRDGSTGAMLMLDVDHFKLVNDTHGHPAGDRLIVEIAGVLRRRTRESDVLARLGGDEFAVVLPRCSLTEAVVVAEAIAASIRTHRPEEDGVEPVTASVGVAMFGEDPRVSAASIVSEADTAMYAAKDGGRDGVRVFDHAAIGEEAPGVE
ncbi:MAG: diguanylate cyclase [Solirubrobacterales bacterium]